MSMKHTTFRFAILVCISGLLLLSKSDAQITIDAFDHGAVDLVGSSSGTSTGLDESHTLGGARSMWVRSTDSYSSQTRLTIFDGGVPGLVMTVPGQSSAAFHIGYGGGFGLGDPVLDEDFYANNQLGFEFIFDEAPNGTRFHITVYTTTGGAYGSNGNLRISGPGVYRIPYTEIINEFGSDSVDMDLASGLFWGIWGHPVDPDEANFAVSSLRTYSVPEPGYRSIFGLIGIAIAVRSSRRQSPSSS